MGGPGFEPWAGFVPALYITVLPNFISRHISRLTIEAIGPDAPTRISQPEAESQTFQSVLPAPV
jgi:hypothetical protein